MSKINVVQGEIEVGVEVLAQAIEKIGATMEAVGKSRLREETIVVLVAASTGVPKTTVRNVLLGLRSLEYTYLKPRGKA